MGDADEFRNKIMAMYEHRQAFGCPTMKCKSLQSAILKENAANTYELCLSVSTLLFLNNIEISTEILGDMAILISRNMIKYNTKCAVTSFEICQACAMSKLMDSKDVQ
jgi:hypothetical protein